MHRPSPLVRKLSHGARLSREDCERLAAVERDRRIVAPRTDLIIEGEEPEHVHLVVSGYACRYKTLDDGSRSIMALLVPGDFCDLHVAILGRMDHSIATVSECEIVRIARPTIERLTERYPTVTRALWWATLVDEAVLREWLVNMGRRKTNQQIAHLFCELYVRMRTVGCTDGNSFAFPLTQDELADTLGISTVHLNRSLQKLREDGLVEFQGRVVTVPDLDRLSRYAGFTANYLHLRVLPDEPPVADERPRGRCGPR
ncbi:Crp/Fnr family transcriptional regulator [Aquibium sp. A9E412]|uniref:Crp/Fnr family transcriptional regulator n=1 Tax=Aquibium sp. A9E412 TaxID=2976767 RepID=UPI0025B1FEED|nr:Crp/Fnr family transcriptional regulator [Aquibium sp. A9E412]MDN2565871.1 Crp/Fnr family transcriptional regulator [Aquibium sp. A9E412]